LTVPKGLSVRREIDQGRLVSTMAFALRHDPARFDLELDDEGWTSFEDLIIAIRFARAEWGLLDEPMIRAAVAGMDRFEIRDGRIRAVYGHSIGLVKPPALGMPPAVLFHGTAAENVPSILQQGLLKMRRQFVHFSTDYEWVVGFLRDKPAWTILAIATPSPVEAGVVFRKANHHVWLTDFMDPRFLVVNSIGQGEVAGI